MLTLYYGSVGSGKTMAMVREAKRAYESGQTVWANIDIDPEAGGWDPGRGGRVVRWHEPIDLIAMGDDGPAVRCGLVLFDELGAIVNNRESDYWPFALTMKLIEHRKDHLDFVASAQVDDMADKNMRRFYNRVYKCTEIRLPLLGLVRPKSRRPAHLCRWPGCNKDGGVMFAADRRGWGTLYRCKDVDPRRTGNIEKHNSAGSKWFVFDPKIAAAYGTASKVSEEAKRWHEKARMEYEARKMGRSRPRSNWRPKEK